MSPEINWHQIAIRLLLTIAAGALLGMERSKTGHFAGLRTTLLVTLAASISMIQMNLLMESNGKPQNSFAVMDLMRLPLGILTGVGFIGAGAILRKNEMIVGITTAATMWFATVVGLCLGGGQLILGSTSALVGFLVLWALRPVENHFEHRQIAQLTVTAAENSISEKELRDLLARAELRVRSLSMIHSVDDHQRRFACEVRWPASEGNAAIPEVVTRLEKLEGMIRIEWKNESTIPG